jgi:hypothetical protein
MIKNMLVKFSKQDPKNQIAVPDDISQINVLSTSEGGFSMLFKLDVEVPYFKNVRPREMKAYRA